MLCRKTPTLKKFSIFLFFVIFVIYLFGDRFGQVAYLKYDKNSITLGLDLPHIEKITEKLNSVIGSPQSVNTANDTAQSAPTAIGTAESAPTAIGTAQSAPTAVGTAQLAPTAVGTAQSVTSIKPSSKPKNLDFETTINGRNLSDVLEEVRMQNFEPIGRDRYVIATCSQNSMSCGGMFERQKVILFAFITALISGRTFVIKSSGHDCPFSSFFDEDKIKWNIETAKFKNLSSQSIIDVKRLGDPYVELRKDVVYTKNYRDFWDIYKKNSFIGPQRLGALYDLNKVEMTGKLIPYILPLKKAMKQEMKNFLLRALPDSDSRLVCAHFRADTGYNIMTIILTFLEKYLDNTNFRFFFAGELLGFKNYIEKRFSQRSMTIDWTLLHSEEYDGCEQDGKVLLEQRLIAFCDVFVVSDSGLGRQAAMIRGTDDNLFCYSPALGSVEVCSLSSSGVTFRQSKLKTLTDSLIEAGVIENPVNSVSPNDQIQIEKS